MIWTQYWSCEGVLETLPGNRNLSCKRCFYTTQFRQMQLFFTTRLYCQWCL